MTHTLLLKRFGEHVLVRRRRLALTQEQLAERTGLSRNAIGEIERGLVNPSLTTVLALARALEGDVSMLLAGLPEPAEGEER